MLLVCAFCGPYGVIVNFCSVEVTRTSLPLRADTVHVFDACTGQYLRDLDTPARLAGAMAVRLGPDGLLYAVAETAGVIRKYRTDTLEPAGDFAQVPGIVRTQTLTAFRAYSRNDLEQAWDIGIE